MLTVRCWLLDDPKSRADVALDDLEELYQSADRFVASHVRMEPGSVAFVFVECPQAPEPEDRFVLWRSECVVGPRPLMLLTKRVTEDEARREIAEDLESAAPE